MDIINSFRRDVFIVSCARYFSMQASNSLGVSDETRIRIENKICREGGPLPECFEEPMENVLTLLEEVIETQCRTEITQRLFY